MKNAEGAAAQVLRATQQARRDIKLYDDLGRRYTALGRAGDAERAYTSIVEVLPNEAEGHQLLAEIRQRQDRWAEAIPHWEQVARIRALEPTGLLGLAAAQLHDRQYDKAAETIGKLKARSWPPHFGNTAGTVADLERQLRAAKKQ
jgi:tetratricopeptide (TPR) repeat protein